MNEQPAAVLTPEERHFWKLMAELDRLMAAQGQAVRDNNWDAVTRVQPALQATLEAVHLLEMQLDLSDADHADRSKRLALLQSQHRAHQATLQKTMTQLSSDLAALEKKKAQLRSVHGAYKEKGLTTSSVYFFS